MSHKLNKRLIYACVYEELQDCSFGFFCNKLYVTVKRLQRILATQQTHELWYAARKKMLNRLLLLITKLRPNNEM
jgi:hypothetical protein